MNASPQSAVIVGLGGNLGGPEQVAERLSSVIENISESWGEGLVSSSYVSAPVGPVADQPDFLNAVAAWWPSRLPSPESALALLQGLEREHGRERLVVGGARTLDLDLLWHAGQVRDSPGLRVPHPRMAGRAFVLQPLQELFGDDYRWDADQPSVGQLLAGSEVALQSCHKYVRIELARPASPECSENSARHSDRDPAES